jgi:hypothetical protein
MRTWIAIACTVSLGASIVDARSSESTEMLDRFLNSGKPALTSYKARRVLTASSMGGRMSATLEAWTLLNPDGTFSFEVIRQEGSGLIRNRVLLAALETEQHSRNQRNLAQSELTPANYEFQVDQDTGEDGMATVRLFPRRQTPMLLNGTVAVKQHDGDIVLIAGSPSKSPSWWTTQVVVVRRYARIAGIRVPLEMVSRADVRIAGESTFSMVYEYESINGRAVTQGQAAALPIARDVPP